MDGESNTSSFLPRRFSSTTLRVISKTRIQFSFWTSTRSSTSALLLRVMSYVPMPKKSHASSKSFMLAKVFYYLLKPLSETINNSFHLNSGESRKPDESTPPPDLVGRGEEKPGTVNHKGHELVAISFHMPTPCEACSKPLWHMFRPPPALECRRCRIKGIYNFIATVFTVLLYSISL